ncbi:MAG TPA: N-acyl homoserine lactonase family protein, partial [Acidimicrobiales bacterium]|nr:N-acyl homoserine lactonase family protein [Acidimicrobiales bacterium]
RYRVHPLLLGEAEVGRALDVFWSLTKESGRVTVPILAFLIEGGPHPILVDTGMRDPARAMEVHRLGPHRTTVEWSLEAQLGRHGLRPADVGAVILTHLHYDHAGGCQQLPRARFLVQRRELMEAAAPIGPRDLEIGSRELFYDRRDIAALVDELWERVDLLEGDEEPYPGIRCVRYANSHTPGSQCVYVETEEGMLALVGDIVRKVDLNVEKGIPPGLFYDLEATRAAISDIRRRADCILPTHDPAVSSPSPPRPMRAGSARSDG